MSDFNFTTKLNSSEIISEIPTEEPDTAEVFWEANLDVRDWGVKDFDISVTKVCVISIDKKGNTQAREYQPDSIQISGAPSAIPLFVTEVIFSDKEVTVVF